jgi:hypothetical protein
VLDAGLAVLTGLESWDTDSIETVLRELPEKLGVGAGKKACETIHAWNASRTDAGFGSVGLDM